MSNEELEREIDLDFIRAGRAVSLELKSDPFLAAINEAERRKKRDARMWVVVLFVGGILLGASTVGMCILGPTATAWTLPLVSTLGCFAVSLGLVLMGSIKSL